MRELALRSGQAGGVSPATPAPAQPQAVPQFQVLLNPQAAPHHAPPQPPYWQSQAPGLDTGVPVTYDTRPPIAAMPAPALPKPSPPAMTAAPLENLQKYVPLLLLLIVFLLIGLIVTVVFLLKK